MIKWLPTAWPPLIQIYGSLEILNLIWKEVISNHVKICMTQAV